MSFTGFSDAGAGASPFVPPNLPTVASQPENPRAGGLQAPAAAASTQVLATTTRVALPVPQEITIGTVIGAEQPPPGFAAVLRANPEA